MSVHKRSNGSWEVRWRDESGAQRSRTLARKGDAELVDASLTRRRQLGPALSRELFTAGLTLDEFVRTGFRTHSAGLATATRKKYVWALTLHLSELADEPLARLDVPRLAQHQLYLLEHGRNPATIREVMKRLSGILQVAAEHGHLPANPARAVRPLPVDPVEELRPLAPAELERLICSLRGRDRAIALLAGHLGLRPLELRAAPWRALDGRTLTVGRARTKRTAARTRAIAVPAVTAHELKAWRLEAGRPGPDAPIVGAMSAEELTAWMLTVLRPAALELLGRDGMTVYALRHSHASALHYAGWTLPAAARRLGHSGVVHLNTYAHVIEALEGRPRAADLDALILEARAAGESGVRTEFA